MGFGIKGAEVQGVLEGGDGVGSAADVRQHDAQIAVEFRAARIKGDGAADQFHGCIGLRLLKLDHAQQMQGIGMIGLAGEDLAIEGLGILESPGLMESLG